MAVSACHDCTISVLEAGNAVCLAKGSNTYTGKEGGMNNCDGLNDGRQKGVVNEASHSWYCLWACPREKATMVASTQLAEGECAMMCRRGTQRYIPEEGPRGKGKRNGCSVIRYGTKEGRYGMVHNLTI